MSKRISKTASITQIPHKYRANRPKIVQWLARGLLRAFRWKVEGLIPPVQGSENLIVIAGPHTSNWDGVFAFAAIIGMDAKISFFGKYTLFTTPILGRFLKYMGGIPVDRSKPGLGLTEIAIKNMSKLNGSLIAMSPEGTRAKTEKFKTGFLRIAEAVEGRIFLASFDFGNKRIFLDKFFNPSGDNDHDLAFTKEYFTQFQAKHPENY
ncbi:1-acyl-sn-glycerol-3-phosphate acyltransferase [Gammaproteobacteria bacterium]|jgi:1-acyl-sn-glycerol-3-phosphate acyltransferase|nr:1-acyl-sn-glycerol-3-phosphate acyltransferase [Gammaproteobacteria bacterium]MDA7829593.1 1-acyl-sn-glycerol-3-phosphate acyltransferase [Gammaproteobacteria bacterium]MDA7844505.1 1-acyl-sn-glycerol-3-phosphate acyltransferase [Gammaproteobacteria bacterium]MDA9102367.1 1-acyl-sn-glycerol-3-phosphate acyltransferase [Gammaproteobacteria bacterium]